MVLEYFKKTLKDKELMKTFIKLAIPLMFQQLIVASVNLVDNLMVGELGDVAVSAVSCCNRYYNLVQFSINGLIMSCIIFLSQFNGAEDYEHMKQTYRFSLCASYLICIIYFLLALFFPSTIIGYIISDENIVVEGTKYLKIACFSYLPLIFSLATSQALRSTGITRVPVRISFVSLIVNLVLNYLLIFGNLGFPMLGVKGAAIATLIARIIEMILYFYCLHKYDCKFKTSLKDLFKIDKELSKQIIVKAIPLTINEVLWQFGYTTILKCYSSRGANANTAYSIAETIYDLFSILIAGMATCTTVLVGTNLGANKLDKAKDNAYKLLCFVMMLSVFFGCLLASSSFLIPCLYSKVSAESIKIAQGFIRVMGIFFIVYVFNVQCFFTLRTGGDTRNTMIMDSCFMWVFAIPVIAICAYLTDIPVLLVYIIGQCSDLVKACVAFRMLRKEKWVKNLTIKEA